MAYLISHIAICLVFAQLLGLLLGWLLWGYPARQRGKEVQTLRERLADMHFMSGAARMAAAPEPRLALQDVPETFSAVELPARPSVRRAFFEDETEQPTALPVASQTTLASPVTAVPPVAPDLEAEVRDSKIQHLQQQVRELEGFRDRLPLLQADLSDAIAGRRSAEARFQEAKNDFEVRSSSLLSQLRDFEAAAAEWDRLREEFERDKIAHQRELAAVQSTLRDLQNSQRPQTVVAALPAVSAPELPDLREPYQDLRERYQRAVREREALAVELASLRQSGSSGHALAPREAELEEALRSRDAQLAEQAAKLESLLWRVAELEPFAAEAPQKEESLRRQESEIAGHMAMHAENAERIRSLQNQVEQLQSSMVPADELQRIISEHQAELGGLLSDHQQRAGELQQLLAMKDDEIAEHVSARQNQMSVLNALQTRITELEGATHHVHELEQALRELETQHQATLRSLMQDHEQRLHDLRSEFQQTDQERAEAAAQQLKALEQSLADRNLEIRALLSTHGETHRELETVRSHTQTLQSELEAKRAEAAEWKARFGELDFTAASQAEELQRIRELHKDQEGQLTYLHERLGVLSSRLSAHQERLLQLEPLAARTPEVEQKLKDLETKHHSEVTRLKVNSAQRIRRFRQGIHTFKA
jgi:chromosome segregation ATPase